MALRDVLRDLTPPLVLRALRGTHSSGLRFEGSYASWDAARHDSSGYARGEITQQVLEAELKVKRGEAVDARDGVSFDSVQFSLPVMAALARAAQAQGSALRVLDFGGAFGGLYRQFRAFGLRGAVAWTVVEQQDYVELGAKHFQNEELRFSGSLEESLSTPPADVVLFSSVLQYMEEPHALLQRIADWGPRHVVVDRTPCSALDRDVLTVQHVPAEIYRASYPCWIFSRRRLLEAFGPGYRMLASFADASGPWRANDVPFVLAGFILDRKS